MEPEPLAETLARARARLVAAGITPDHAAADVDVLARAALGWDRARLLASLREPVPAALEPRFSDWLSRRERREPTAYILGRREFWGLDFLVTPAVLVPRPETELVVEEALALWRSGSLTATVREDGRLAIADVGTGSGNIAVSLAREVERSVVTATDVSAEALDVARHNARRLGVGDRVTFVRTTFLSGVASTFDLIVANPPYVNPGDAAALSPDVRHEPDVALFSDAAGLAAPAAVLDAAAVSLRVGGWLVMEFGLGQDDAVIDLMRARPVLRLDHVRHDLQDIPRTLVIQRRG